MFTRTRHLCALAVLGLVVLCSAAFADLGLLPLTPEQFEAVPEWKPDPEGYGTVPRVDLRPDLPPVGWQNGQGSCAGFAVAYACKSYLEAKDQGWRPDSARRIFSPAFVYNQINGGRNRGSSILNALNLLVRRGCATLATMPYNPRDYRTQPSRAAFAEAASFRCKGYYAVRSGALLRRALQQGHVVVMGILTDPIFMSGRYRIFTSRERQRGLRLRRPGDPHGHHAICVVGYDDTRSAFLLMNSWSRNWGQQGYCWVHYDLMRTISPRGTNFAWHAWVLLDIEQKITGGAAALAIRGSYRYGGYQRGNHAWLWRVHITGSQAAVKNIRQVVWQAGTRRYVSADPLAAYQCVGTATGSGVLPIQASVALRDGSTRSLKSGFNFRPPSRRNLRLVQTDRYWGRQGTQPYWEWSLKLQGRLVDLADVKQVTYHLHPSFKPADRVVQATAQNGFAFTTRGWGTFTARATVLFHDRTTLALSCPIAFKDPVRDALTLRNAAQPSGVSDTGQQLHSWTAYLDGPLALLRRIRSVRYHLHPTFRPSVVDVAGGEEFGFPLSRNGWGVFTIKATVRFDNGTIQQFSHGLKFSSGAAAGQPKK